MGLSAVFRFVGRVWPGEMVLCGNGRRCEEKRIERSIGGVSALSVYGGPSSVSFTVSSVSSLKTIALSSSSERENES